MFSVLVIRLRSLRLLRVSGIVMRLRMFLLLITFLKASHRSEERRVGKECRSAWTASKMKNKCTDFPNQRPIIRPAEATLLANNERSPWGTNDGSRKRTPTAQG